MTLPESPTPVPPGMVRLRVVDSVAARVPRGLVPGIQGVRALAGIAAGTA